MGEEIRRTIVTTVDEQAANKAVASLAKIRKAETELANDVGKTNSAYAKATTQLDKVAKAGKDAERDLARVGNSFRDQASDVDRATSALDQYEDRLRRVQRGGADLSGDIASSAGGLRGVADFAGAGAVGGGFEAVEALADIGEFAPRAGAALTTLGESILESNTAAGRAVGGFANATSSVTGLNASTIALGATAAPVILAFTALAVVFNRVKKEAEEQAKVIESRLSATFSLNEELARGTITSQEARDRLAELTATQEAQAENLASANELYAQTIDGIRTSVTEFIAQGLVPIIQLVNVLPNVQVNLRDVEAALNAVGEGAVFVTQQIDGREQALVTSVQNTQQALIDTESEIAALEGALEESAFASADATQAEQERADAVADYTQQLEQLTAQQEQQQSALLQAQEQVSNFRAQARQEDIDAAQEAALERRFAREDQLAQEREQQEKLADIRAKGLENVRRLEAEFADLGAERAEALADVEREGNDKLRDLREQYQEDTRASFADFNESLADNTSETAKRIQRIGEDLLTSLDEATRDNDVRAFLQAERDANKEIARTREDAAQEQKQLVQEFEQQRNEALSKFQQAQTTIRNEINEERAEVIQSYAERGQALQEAIQAERTAIQERLAAQEQQFAEQEAREQQRAERARQRADLRAQQEARRDQEALNRLQERVQIESSALQELNNQARQVRDSIANISRGGASRGGGGFNPFSAFNAFQRSSINNSQSFNANVNVGDNVNEDRVRNIVQSGLTQFAGLIARNDVQGQQRRSNGRGFVGG